MSADIFALGSSTAWRTLTQREKQYAYHLSRAAWHGTRIIMRQTSSESIDIFDLILELYRSCSGAWPDLARNIGVSETAMQDFLDYASCFLSNVGNYFGKGSQKILPRLLPSEFEAIASATSTATQLWYRVCKEMYAAPPFNLGFPSETCSSEYYVGSAGPLTQRETLLLEQVMAKHRIYPENTRVEKSKKDTKVSLVILQASSEKDIEAKSLHMEADVEISLQRGDHSHELEKICSSLRCAADYTPDERNRQPLMHLIQSLETGDLQIYREHIKQWLNSLDPKIESVFGFVEPYRDPSGTKAEFEGIVGISNGASQQKIKTLVSDAERIIRRLPWVAPASGSLTFGPFENSSFRAPPFVCFDTLAYCSSTIFPGINLPNYNDIREKHGHKSLIVSDRMQIEARDLEANPLINTFEQERFQELYLETYELYVMLHELYGHPTGRLIISDEQPTETIEDAADLPINPLTGSSIKTWYLPHQAWTSVFGDLSTTVDECRCELVAAYVMDDDNLLNSLGYTNNSATTPDDILYNLYQQLASDGIHGLLDYHPTDKTWGSAHSQAHFAMLTYLVRHGEKVIRISLDSIQSALKIQVDRSLMRSCGTRAVAQMLLHLHIYRCTADIDSCRKFYTDLCNVTDDHLVWRTIIQKVTPPQRRFVQSNLLDINGDGEIVQKHYPATMQGIIASWAERDTL